MRAKGCDLKEVAARAARRLMSYPWKVWFWGDSIGLEGLLDASEFLGSREYESFVYGMVKDWMARRQPAGRWDYTAPGVSILRLDERLPDPALLSLAWEHAEYLAGFRRTEEGAFVRYADADFDLPPELPSDHPDAKLAEKLQARARKAGPCIFVDNMHFDGPFYAGLCRLTGDDRWRQLALDNIFPSIDLLFDEEHSLFHHFWIEERKRPNGVLWGRGQGWALLGIVHTLEALDPDDPAVPRLREVLERHSRALAEAQDPSGHWHTVVTDPASYLETSVAAFVVDGFSRAIRHGWIEEAYRPTVDRAFEALLEAVKADGTLDGVSYETYPSLSADHYKTMPRGAMVPWGQGPLLAAIRSYAGAGFAGSAGG